MLDVAPPDTTIVSALGLGFVLGLQHALDADHLVAVSTIVSQNRSVARSSLIGAVWGVGHTTSLLAMGLLVIVLRWSISERTAAVLELGVAFMLIGLGLNLLRRTLQVKLHSHEHRHGAGDSEPAHRHLHVHGIGAQDHTHRHMFGGIRRPLLVGLVHGLAGSAALMLLVLARIPSPWLGLAYIAIFGLGSIGGMLAMSSLIGLPFVWTARRSERIHRGIQLSAGAFSTGFGLLLAWEITSQNLLR